MRASVYLISVSTNTYVPYSQLVPLTKVPNWPGFPNAKSSVINDLSLLLVFWVSAWGPYGKWLPTIWTTSINTSLMPRTRKYLMMLSSIFQWEQKDCLTTWTHIWEKQETTLEIKANITLSTKMMEFSDMMRSNGNFLLIQGHSPGKLWSWSRPTYRSW